MAASWVVLKDMRMGSGEIKIGKVTFDASYPTGGYSFTVPLRYPYMVIASGGGYIYEWDRTNKKLKVLYFDYDAAADGAAVEVPNGTDLSGVTADFIAVVE